MYLALSTVETTTALTPIVSSIGTITELVGEVFTVMTSNPLLVVFLGGSLLTVGISFFRRLKRAAKG